MKAPAFEEAAPSRDRDRLVEVQKKVLEHPKRVHQLASSADLAAVVPEELAGFASAGEAQPGPEEVFGKPVRTLSRRYKSSRGQAYINVTDTGKAPELRSAFAQKLTLQGDDNAGGQRGTFIEGYPALEAHYADHASSSVTVLVADRYLIDVRVKPAASADAARRIVEDLDLPRLPSGAAAGSAGQGAPPEGAK